MLGGEVLADNRDDADIGEVAGGKRKICRCAAENVFAPAGWRSDVIECNGTNSE
jgi:hypothetical protein